MKRGLFLLVTLLMLCLLAGCATNARIEPKGRVIMGGSIERGY